MMNWHDTVLKTKEIKLGLKIKNDDSLDLTIPLQKLAEVQAEKSFAAGVIEAMLFIGEANKEGIQIDTPMLKAQMVKWGLKKA